MLKCFGTRLEEKILNNPALGAAFLGAWRIHKLPIIKLFKLKIVNNEVLSINLKMPSIVESFTQRLQNS